MRRMILIPLIILPALWMWIRFTPQIQPTRTQTIASHVTVRFFATQPARQSARQPTSQPAQHPTPTASPAATVAAAIAIVDPTATAEPEAAPAQAQEDQAKDAAPSEDSVIWSDANSNQLLELHNQARGQAGLPGYRLSPVLQRAAQSQADYLASQPAAVLMQLGASGHKDAQGGLANARAARFGYASSRVDENWAYVADLQEAFQFWVTDEWHRPQVMSSEYTEVGFGVVAHPGSGIVFVAVYGRP